PSELATHTTPSPMATSFGSLPTLIVSVPPWPPRGILETVPAASATHAAPNPTATAVGEPDSDIRLTTPFVEGSISESVPLDASSTHSAPSPSISRLPPVGMVLRIAPVMGSTRSSDPELSTQTEPSAYATPPQPA